jgi:hypothetical protein
VQEDEEEAAVLASIFPHTRQLICSLHLRAAVEVRSKWQHLCALHLEGLWWAGQELSLLSAYLPQLQHLKLSGLCFEEEVSACGITQPMPLCLGNQCTWPALQTLELCGMRSGPGLLATLNPMSSPCLASFVGVYLVSVPGMSYGCLLEADIGGKIEQAVVHDLQQWAALRSRLPQQNSSCQLGCVLHCVLEWHLLKSVLQASSVLVCMCPRALYSHDFHMTNIRHIILHIPPWQSTVSARWLCSAIAPFAKGLRTLQLMGYNSQLLHRLRHALSKQGFSFQTLLIPARCDSWGL